MNKEDLWAKYVGDQTPKEFMRQSGTDDPGGAVSTYLAGHEFTPGLSAEELHDLARHLEILIDSDQVQHGWFISELVGERS